MGLEFLVHDLLFNNKCFRLSDIPFLAWFWYKYIVESSTMSQELYFMNKFVEKNCRNGELVSFIYLSDQTTCRNNQNKRITWPRFKKYRRLFVCLHSFRNIIELNLISILRYSFKITSEFIWNEFRIYNPLLSLIYYVYKIYFSRWSIMRCP